MNTDMARARASEFLWIFRATCTRHCLAPPITPAFMFCVFMAFSFFFGLSRDLPL
jgi:hypothetical protein